jgi:hypothetical protein
MNGEQLYDRVVRSHDGSILAGPLRIAEWKQMMEQETNPYLDYRQQQLYENMKRRLTGDQFGNRYPVMDREHLSRALESYAMDLDTGVRSSRVLLTELPLKHELVRLSWRPPGKDEDIIITLLRGYRIYEIRRSKPDDPKLLTIYSLLTGLWHRVGFADMGKLGHLGPRLTDAGCYALGNEMLGQGPEPVRDEVLVRCLMVDQLPSKSRHWVTTMARAGRWQEHSIRYLYESWGLADDESIPNPVRLARILNRDPESVAKIWEVVDRYGIPEGPLGETLRHMDNFRTF